MTLGGRTFRVRLIGTVGGEELSIAIDGERALEQSRWSALDAAAQSAAWRSISPDEQT